MDAGAPARVPLIVQLVADVVASHHRVNVVANYGDAVHVLEVAAPGIGDFGVDNEAARALAVAVLHIRAVDTDDNPDFAKNIQNDGEHDWERSRPTTSNLTKP